MRKPILAVFTLALGMAAVAAPVRADLYAVHTPDDPSLSGAYDGFSQLYILDLASQSARHVMDFNMRGVMGIDFHPSTGEMYAIGNDSGPGGWYAVDPVAKTTSLLTGAGTQYGTDLSFTPDERFIYTSWRGDPNPLRTKYFDPATTNVTQPSRLAPGDPLWLGLAWRPSDSFQYFVTETGDFYENVGNNGSSLRSSLAPSGPGLAFDAAENLYGIEGDTVYRLSIPSGAPTQSWSFSGLTFSAIAFGPDLPIPAPAAGLILAPALLLLFPRRKA